MEDLSSSQSLVKRVQRIRERMLVEQLSGIHASDKASFLFQCRAYEGRLSDVQFRPEAVWQRYTEQSAWDERGKHWNDWEDWSDWHKF